MSLAALAAAGAQPAAADDLRQALIDAYENNPTLASARASLRALDESVPIAAADGRPSANVQGNFTEFAIPNANAFTAPDRQVSANIGITTPIYRGGGVRNAVRAAQTRVEAGQADLRATESDIFSATVTAYMNVIRDAAIVGLNETNVEVLTVNLEATRDRFQIGDLTRTDVAQSEARLALAVGDLQTAEANLITSRENYVQLVGNSPGELEPPPPLPNLPETVRQAVDVAIDSNPQLIGARERSRAGRFDIEVAEASRRPTVDATAQGTVASFLDTLGGGSNLPASVFSQEQATVNVGATVTIPIYQGGRPAALVRRAQAQSQSLFETEIATERQIIQQVRSSFAIYRASLEVIASSEAAVEANELALEGVRAEQSVGLRQVLDVLNAEQELLNSQVQLIGARRNAYVAGFNLLAAMGRAEARDLGLDGGAFYDPLVHYEEVRNSWFDYSARPDPLPVASRTIDTLPENAEISRETQRETDRRGDLDPAPGVTP